MDPQDIEFLKSLPKKEAARILHARSVALQMRLYQKSGIISVLGMLVYGSDKVFDRFPQSLGDTYLQSYLSRPLDERDSRDALTHCLHVEHTDAQTAAILMTKLDRARLAMTSAQMDVSTKQLETALTIGIAELMNTGQIAQLQVISLSLSMGAMALTEIRRR